MPPGTLSIQAAEPQQAEQSRRSVESAPRLALIWGRGLNTRISLLVAEDEALVRLAMQEMLEGGGYEVVAASSGEMAMSLIMQGSCPYGGLITDIRLGGELDGWALARAARARVPDICVIYVTGDSAADWSAKGVPQSLVLQKPVADAQILTGISMLLNDRSGLS